MRVGIVVQDNYPIDREVRTRKIARGLDEEGHDVVIFARNTREDPELGRIADEYWPVREEFSYVTVKRLS